MSKEKLEEVLYLIAQFVNGEGKRKWFVVNTLKLSLVLGNLN